LTFDSSPALFSVASLQCASLNPFVPTAPGVATLLHVKAVVPLIALALWAAKALTSSAQSMQRPTTALRPFIG
jgi:hypothetical protein